jgi:hypothetical protein
VTQICPERRRFTAISMASATALTWPVAGRSQPVITAQAPRSRAVLLQCIDTSSDQQEITRDFSSGVRLGIGSGSSRAFDLQEFPMDGSSASMNQLVSRLRTDTSIMGLLGTCGERLALRCTETMRSAGLRIAHIGPWIADDRFDNEPGLLKLFASRQAQIRYAISKLESVGVREIGLVYSSAATKQQVQSDVQSAMRRINVQHQEFVAPAGNIEQLVASLPSNAPAAFLFIGGTIELARFIGALTDRKLQRYVVALGETDLATLTELGVTRSVPVVLTQVVPNPQSHSPVIRQYRAALGSLYEESPTPLSFAGYLVGRYARGVMASLGSVSNTRSALFERTRSKPEMDLGGYSIRFEATSNRGSRFVTQTLIGRDGRLIG